MSKTGSFGSIIRKNRKIKRTGKVSATLIKQKSPGFGIIIIGKVKSK